MDTCNGARQESKILTNAAGCFYAEMIPHHVIGIVNQQPKRSLRIKVVLIIYLRNFRNRHF
jgi:hypothetical protein